MLMTIEVSGSAINMGVVAGIAVFVVVLLGVVFWSLLYAHRARQITGDAVIVSDTGELLEPTDAVGEGWMMLQGERWRIRCATPLPAGAPVRVIRRQGLLLWVEPV